MVILTGVEVWCIHPIGQKIASGSGGKTVQLWDVDSGECLVLVHEFQETVAGSAWKATLTGCYDKSIRKWQVVEKEGRTRVNLNCSSYHDRLVLTDTSIEGIQDLSNLNRQLLRQRGATCGAAVAG